MKWLLVSILLNSHNAFELKVVDNFETEKECRQMIGKFKLTNPYLACLNPDDRLPPENLISQEKNKMIK